MAFAVYRSKALLRRLAGKRRLDDFYWEDYNVRYRTEVEQNERTQTQQLRGGEYVYDAGVLRKDADILPLHPNFRLLYETILQLEPASVLELGCGGGDHLHNLKLLSPELEVRGIEHDAKQIAYLRERNPDLRAEIRQVDATLPFPRDVEAVDLAYTQAVLMHLQTGKSHLVALWNLFKSARLHVVLMEHWGRHRFLADIEMLKATKLIDWPEVNTYYRVSEELRRPHILVASRERLSYPALTDYAVLADPVAR